MESKVMAIVNGVEILESDVDRFIELMGDRALPYKNPEGKKQLCEELVKQELIIQDCYNRKLNESEAFVKEINEITRSILAKHFLNELFGDIKVSDEEIKKYYEKSGLPLKKFFNTSGNVYKQMNLKEKLAEMSEDEQFELLASNGMVLKRPLFVGKDFVLVGFKEAEWAEKLK